MKIANITSKTPINQIRGIVFSYAWRLKRRKNITISEALKEAWARANNKRRRNEKVNESAEKMGERVSVRVHRKKVDNCASSAQFRYLCALIGEDAIPYNERYFRNHVNKRDASRAIEVAKHPSGQVVFDEE